MESSIVEKVKEIVNQGEELIHYTKVVLEYCYPDKNEVVLKTVYAKRSKETGLFELPHILKK